MYRHWAAVWVRAANLLTLHNDETEWHNDETVWDNDETVWESLVDAAED